MIIDAHTHTFPDKIAAHAVDVLEHNSHTKPFSDGTVEGLAEHEAEAGVDLAVVLPVATDPHQVAHINNRAYETNCRYDGKQILSFASIHPDLENYREELTRIAEMGFKGIKVHPVYQGVDIDDIRFLRILDRAAELNLIVVTHGGTDVGFPDKVHCSPAQIRNAAKQIGDFHFIAAHMGGWKNWNDVPSLLTDTCVYIDTSFSIGSMVPLDGDDHYTPDELKLLDPDQFMKLFRAFGARRILFGTDSPWGDPKRDIAFIKSLPISEEDKALILGGNMENLLNAGNPR